MAKKRKQTKSKFQRLKPFLFLAPFLFIATEILTEKLFVLVSSIQLSPYDAIVPVALFGPSLINWLFRNQIIPTKPMWLSTETANLSAKDELFVLDMVAKAGRKPRDPSIVAKQ